MPYTFVSYLPLLANLSNASIGSTTPTNLPSVVSCIPGGNVPSPSAIKYSNTSPAGKSESIALS